ncbi:hypothetical protein BD413DRAFT_565226 [Trametes elegans]|nr:hypothetical protein BD413DRAFT_565226 [Trametes elegans]
MSIENSSESEGGASDVLSEIWGKASARADTEGSGTRFAPSDAVELKGARSDIREEVLFVVDVSSLPPSAGHSCADAEATGTAMTCARRLLDLAESCVEAEIEAEMLPRRTSFAPNDVSVGEVTRCAVRELRRDPVRDETLLIEWLARNVSLASGGRWL